MTRPIFASASVLEAYRSQYPLGRVGTGGDIAEAALWLASDECFMTGENLHVNGGLSLRGFPDSQSLVSAIERASPEKQAEFARLFGSQ
jgi:hypothetical protein